MEDDQPSDQTASPQTVARNSSRHSSTNTSTTSPVPSRLGTRRREGMNDGDESEHSESEHSGAALPSREVANWLLANDLAERIDAFTDAGYTNLSQIREDGLSQQDFEAVGISDEDEKLQLLRAIDKLRVLASVNQLRSSGSDSYDSDASPASSPASSRSNRDSSSSGRDGKDGKDSPGPSRLIGFTRSRSRTTISKTPRALRRLARLGKATSGSSARKKLEARLRTWLLEMLPEYEVQLTDPAAQGNLAAVLCDGRLLCDLVNRLLPGTIDSVSSSDKPFKQVQNIGRYLSACRRIGLSAKYLFVPSELQQGENLSAVLENLNQLRTLYESGGALSLRKAIEENRSAAYVASCDDDLVQRKAQKYDATYEKEITQWVFEKLGQPLPSSGPVSFHSVFRNGVYLCKLINRLRPGTIASKHIYTGSTPFKQINNVNAFLAGCQTLGLNKDDLFAPSDLYEEKNLSAVHSTLHVLRFKVEPRTPRDGARSAAVRGRSATVAAVAQPSAIASSSPRPAGNSAATSSTGSKTKDQWKTLHAEDLMLLEETEEELRMVNPVAPLKLPPLERLKLGEYPLHELARMGHVDALNAYLRKNPDVDFISRDPAGLTCLHIAAEEGWQQVAELVLERSGTDLLEVVDTDGWSPLSFAAACHRLEMCLLLLRKGASATHANRGGLTALHTLTSFPFTERMLSVFRALLEGGADLDADNQLGQTPLHMAVSAGNLETTEFLLLAGADVNTQTRFGETALHHAARLSKTDRRASYRLCKELFQHGADPSLESIHGPPWKVIEVDRLPKLAALFPNAPKPSGTPAEYRRTIRKLKQGRRFDSMQKMEMVMERARKKETIRLQVSPLAASADPAVDASASSSSASSSSGVSPSMSSSPPPLGSGSMKRLGHRRTASSSGVSSLDRDRKPSFLGIFNSGDQSADDNSPRMQAAASASYKRDGGQGSAPASPMFSRRLALGVAGKGNTPLIQDLDGYLVDERSGERGTGDLTNLDPMLSLALDYYDSHFLGRKHRNYVGRLAIGTVTEKDSSTGVGGVGGAGGAGGGDPEPCIISVQENPEADKLHALVRTPTFEKFVCFQALSALTPKGKEKEKHSLLRAVAQTLTPLLNDGEFELVTSKQLEKGLLEFEENDPQKTTCFPVGVVYSKDGQQSQWDMWNNKEGSQLFQNFLDFLGDRVRLKGWTEYAGGLDTKADARGKYSYYTALDDAEIMFHVSTCLPYDPLDERKLQRSRMIGNDIAMIIFQEGDTTYIPNTMTGGVSHVFVVVRPVEDDDGMIHYQVSTCYKDYVKPFKPHFSATVHYPENQEFRSLLLAKLINGHLSAQQSPGLMQMYSRPRRYLLQELVDSYSKGRNTVQLLRNPD
eukprot:CAMPEP_0174233214 /NCGR_PEP_ID=MMETSP0417-20130205/3303_1 /TAXON_ID=242541 /ORGANISM="Mayorella sp, Strain BSH-02190019" /LENGTH=1365 /DNA_ID=CAMNT_0015311385 /DNA_START=63 /DNA_END=4157 /DNA_ORIENTATION=+